MVAAAAFCWRFSRTLLCSLVCGLSLPGAMAQNRAGALCDAASPQPCVAAPAPAAKRRVLVIYSYSDAQPWQRKVRQGLEEGIQQEDAGMRIELFEENLDAIRLAEPADTTPMADYLRSKYAGMALDAAITEGQNAAAFLLAHPALLRDVPSYILNYAATPDAAQVSGRRMVFVSHPADLERAVTVVPEVLPAVHHVIAVTDRTVLGRRRGEQLLALAPSLSPGIRLEVWDSFTQEELATRAAQLGAGTALLYLPVFSDNAGRPLAPTDVLRQLSAASAVPVFTHFDVLLGHGAVGGYMVSAHKLGALVARIALYGEPGGAGPTPWQAVSGYFFDEAPLKRWGIDRQRLPGGSVVVPAEASGWWAYRWYAAGALALLALQSILLATLGLMMRERNRAITALDAGHAFLEEMVEARTQELQETNALMANLAAQVPGTLFQLRRYPDGWVCVPYASQNLKTILELDPAQVRDDAGSFFALLHPEDRDAVIASFIASEKSLAPWHHEFRAILPTQGLCWRMGHCQPEKLDDGSVLWHGLISDITQRKRDEELVRHLAQHDKLTGLANRALFMDRLERQVARARRDHGHLALVFMDLNGFKPVNDTFGHAVGDLLLQEAAQRMLQCVRDSDTVARLGGDEFVVLLPTAGVAPDAMVVAEKIRHAMAQPYQLESHRVCISASLGIALYPQHGGSAELLLQSADAAMYQAKQSGREEVRLLE
jgi:diguanylate cyclase (GGDEF)-like protein